MSHEIQINQLQIDECRDIIYSERYGDFIIEGISQIPYLGNMQLECSQNVSNSMMITYVEIAGSQDINFRKFGYSAIPALFGLLDTSSMENVGVLRLRRQPYIELYGRDVLIGFIDTGIDYQHSVFRNEDGTTRVRAIWDQTQRYGTPPEGFLYGGYYTREDIDEALLAENPLSVVPTIDEIGHGTFNAGIAAGGQNLAENFTGVAPQAGIVVVKLKEAKRNLKEYACVDPNKIAYSEADILLAVRFLIEEAERQSKPMVILLGVGTNSGNHDGEIPLSKILEQYGTKVGLAIVVGGGNEGNRGHHYVNTELLVGDNEEVEIRVEQGEYGLMLELWCEAPRLFSVGITSPLGEVIPKVPIQDKAPQRFRLTFEETLIYVEYVLIEELSGDQVVVIRMNQPTPGIWKIRVYNEEDESLEYNAWLPMEQFIKEGTYFLQPQPNTTLCEPANTENIITVNAFNHYDNSIFVNASRGFTRSQRYKPDIAAPGVNVFGPFPGERFGRRTGASVAAAHVAGCAAIMLEWGIVKENAPDMQSVRLNSYFIRGARRRNILYPNREWGYGEMDLYQTFEQILF